MFEPVVLLWLLLSVVDVLVDCGLHGAVSHDGEGGVVLRGVLVNVHGLAVGCRHPETQGKKSFSFEK